MQFSPGYGSHPQNYKAPSGNFSQVPSKAIPSQLENYYGADYYSPQCSVPAQNANVSSVTPKMLNSQGSQHLYNRAPHNAEPPGPFQGTVPPASQLHTSISQSYSSFTGPYNNSVLHSASSSVPSQGFVASSSHYSMPPVSSAAYPNIVYPPMSTDNPYGQMPSIQPVMAHGHLNAAGAYSNQTRAPPIGPPRVPLGYTSASWSAPELQLAQGNHGSFTGSLPEANNTMITGSPHYVNQNIQSVKPNQGVASAATSSVKTSIVEKTGKPITSSCLTQSSDSFLHEAIDSSSTTSSASPVLNNYDTLEGDGYPETCSAANSPPPISSVPQMSKVSKSFGCGYPPLQPGYQNVTPSLPSPAMQPSSSGYNSGFSQYPQVYPTMNQLSASLGGLGIQQPESLRPLNLIQERNILPIAPVSPPLPNLNSDLKKLNCSPDSFRCTLTNIPQTQALLNKAKLPLGLLLHPFRDLTQLPVITSSTIVRCRSCRTYINPFVSFIDQRRWKCNLCYRVNDVPEEFMYNPLTRSYGEPHKRPEVQNSTVEFIASSDYMLRPPQPAVYLFVFDVSHNAIEAGYLEVVCQSLLENLDKLPGDTRTKIGFITFDSTVQFYNLQEGLSQPQMLIVSEIDDVFLPMPDSLLVNLHESKELIKDLLNALPNMFTYTRETHSALGPALQAAFKLMSPTGGRVSVFQTQLPSVGTGYLHSREDPNQRSSTKVVQHLGPATDFYKKLALDCSGQQTAVDLFLLSSQYSDLASLACMSKYSAGCVYYYPSFHHIHNPVQTEKLQKDLKRYFTRKIGFEAVMRIRCTKGLSIHTFHGNFFVRSTDLLSLANVNPDAGFAVQMSIEENLTDTSLVCFQTALLYTSSKGERRIRVHTLCLPVVTSLMDVYAGADVQAVICLLANMAVDRSVSSSLSDARDALANAVVDSLSAYMSTASNLQQSSLIAPYSLRLFPLYVLALFKQKAFRTGTSTRLDDRIYAMCQIKSQPLVHLMKIIYPSLYRIDKLTDEGAIHVNDRVVPQPPLQRLSAEKLTREGAYLMDCGLILYIWLGRSCDNNFIKDVLGYPNYLSVPQKLTQLPELDNISSERTRSFITWLKDNKSLNPVLQVIKDESPAKTDFLQQLIEDKTEAAFSYYEFLLHIQQQICK
ncbi:protein transport protein Sec24B isoform X2 [Pantherophis guttatus]|uniref:Protein transport protein Sec24B isoform X2 n=1 Tax=Pantherophis guttatus TaxID=94885 RepID=A0A6P9E4A9_PANGU|nr:protein transport protein Sec24B isoform X2 [Pantherophis guttatus]